MLTSVALSLKLSRSCTIRISDCSGRVLCNKSFLANRYLQHYSSPVSILVVAHMHGISLCNFEKPFEQNKPSLTTGPTLKIHVMARCHCYMGYASCQCNILNCVSESKSQPCHSYS